MFKKLYLFKKIENGMLQPKHIVDYPMYFYEHRPGKVPDIIVKNKKIVGWTVTIEKQLVKFNVGSKEELKEVLIDAILPSVSQSQIKKVLMEYKDAFAWNYKELKGIARKACEHKIELMVNVQLVKKKKNKMNFNYALKK